MTDSSHVCTPYLGDEIWDLKSAGFFSIFLLAEEIRLNVLDDSMRRHGLPRETIYGERLYEVGNVDQLGSPWSANVFGVLSAVRASKLLEAER
ncbi:hypothetical protein AVEN_8664-1 [Araneus ventricosus]|uniref:Uncharacterized protein n=1 Tax=Araneus ventricosus TaxID=182803 RepID=A0A4Y2C650_ARAVE|nr:hypothetical protein AVEN_8664-1 [Araneus ventricosus]